MKVSDSSDLVYGSIISQSPQESDSDYLFSDGFIDNQLYVCPPNSKPYRHFMRNLFLVLPTFNTTEKSKTLATFERIENVFQEQKLKKDYFKSIIHKLIKEYKMNHIVTEKEI